MPKTKGSQLKKTAVCVFCKSGEDDEMRFGKFYHSKEISVHNFCLLFSSGLSQNGKNDNDGFVGFLPKDIKAEVVRGQRLRCSYCKITGATIGCCKPACKKVFHLNCGLKHNSLHLFYGSFPSYCTYHKAKPIYPEGELLTKEFYCAICYNAVHLKNYDTTVWTSCCKNGWFHKPCIQRQAFSAGYFFRCPLCNNTEQFQKQMLLHGIYIPQQDAAWELEENAFQELLFRHEQCDANRCLCPKGRKYSRKTSQWRIVLCQDCGSQGRHVGCDSSVTAKFTWKCEACIEITKKLKSKKENECSNKQVKKTNIHKSQKSQSQRRKGKQGMLRSSSRNNSTEVASAVEDDISSASKEEQKSDEANSELTSESGPSFSAHSNHRNYKIIKITKRQPHNFEDLVEDTGCSELPGALSEIDVPVDNVESKGYTESLHLEQENIGLFSDVAFSLPSDFHSSYKSEIFHQGDENELKEELLGTCLNHSSSSDCKGTRGHPVVDNSASHILPNSENVDFGTSGHTSVKNETYIQQHGKKLFNDSFLIETKDCKKEKANTASGNRRVEDVAMTVNLVDCKTVLSQKSGPVDISCDSEEHVEKEESKETASAKNYSPQISVSSDTSESSNKICRRHSKRHCVDVEDKLPKKLKLNGPSVKSCKRVIILNITQEIRHNPSKKHKCAVDPSNKTVNEVTRPTLSSNSIAYNGHGVDERPGKELFDAENILGKKKSPIIMSICDDVEHSAERDREPLVRVGVTSGLVQNTLKVACTSSDCAVPHDGGKCTSKSDIEYENRALKKQKLNTVTSRKNYTSSFKYKDHYLCIKALLGKPCDCCREKSGLSKQTNAKNVPHRKIQGCKHKRKYDINFIKSGSTSSNSDGKPFRNKHSCNYPPNYVVDFFKSGSQMPSNNEPSEKLSVKPQVIHLKNVSH